LVLMVREIKCSFCGSAIRFGTGIMYVKNDGVIMNFCSSKCRKSMTKLHRDPRKLKWTMMHPSTKSRKVTEAVAKVSQRTQETTRTRKRRK
jgi:large subunit ribosomal protein L24e